MTTRIDVSVGDGGYPVFCGAGAATKAAEYRSASPMVFVSNETVWKLHEKTMSAIFGEEFFPPVLLPDGEEYKTLDGVAKIIDEFVARDLRRDATVVAFGGGVVGDVAGFAAATYMRGIRLIQMPTTLLAQVDAAVGGKTGVNHPAGKNLIGAFYQPAVVLCDSDFLTTLPEREYRAGLAEVVKYALLRDAEFFAWLEDNADALLARENDTVQNTVARCVRMKAEIVAADERETGEQRALLNLGHTFAHALENITGYGAWLHGEAVAAGLVAAAKLSEKMMEFPPADTARIVELLARLGLPISFSSASMDETTTGGLSFAEAMLSAMSRDKKHAATTAHFVLSDKIGHAQKFPVSDMALVRAVLEEMQ